MSGGNACHVFLTWAWVFIRDPLLDDETWSPLFLSKSFFLLFFFLSLSSPPSSSSLSYFLGLRTIIWHVTVVTTIVALDLVHVWIDASLDKHKRKYLTGQYTKGRIGEYTRMGKKTEGCWKHSQSQWQRGCEVARVVDWPFPLVLCCTDEYEMHDCTNSQLTRIWVR